MVTDKNAAMLGLVGGNQAMARLPVPPLLNPRTVPKFVNPLPNLLAPGFFIDARNGGTFNISISQGTHNFGLGTGIPQGQAWGYHSSSAQLWDAAGLNYLGPAIVVQKDVPITVNWTSNLPKQHLLPVDTSLHWAFTRTNYTISNDGVPVVTHLHGGHNRSQYDGLPDAWFTSTGKGGRLAINNGNVQPYTYFNDQEAGNIWYHDHALGITRLNVYAGLAGFYIVRDRYDTGGHDDLRTPQNEGNPLGLPGGAYEIPLAIQDRQFTANGQLFYPSAPPVPGAPDPSVLPEFFGDTILVNGKAWPVLDVEPRQYRFRLLNGSDSRSYNLFFDGGVKFSQIGTDVALLNAPVDVNKLFLAPGERADVVVDFSKLAGKTIVMQNNAGGPMRRPTILDPQTTGQIMAFRVNKPLDPNYPLTPVPATLRGGANQPAAIAPLTPTIDPVTGQPITKKLALFEGMDDAGRIKPQLGTVANGALRWEDPITEYVKLGNTEVWEFYNTTPDAHPIHLHQTSFQILNRQKFTATQLSPTAPLTNINLLGQPKLPAANEAGWKDTVVVNPGEVARIVAKFDLPGEYVWHCHILSHEDHEMMRPYQII
jgi:spore coat protein A